MKTAPNSNDFRSSFSGSIIGEFSYTVTDRKIASVGKVMSNERLKIRIRRFLRDNDITVSQFAEMAGLEENFLVGAQRPSWEAPPLVLDHCIDAISLYEVHEDTARAPSETDLPWRLIHRGAFEELRECAALWSALGRDRLKDVTDLLSRHSLADRVVVTSIRDNSRVFMERFSPMTWGHPNSVAGRPVANLPDRRFGKFAEQAIVRARARDEPHLVRCMAPIETAIGEYVVPYSAVRLPFGPIGQPTHVMTVSRLEKGAYHGAQGHLVARGMVGKRHPKTSATHLRLVRS